MPVPAPPRPPTRLPLRKRVGFALIAALVVYVAVEAALSLAWTRVVPSVWWVFEESGPLVRFDPVPGYRVEGGPARVAKFTRGGNPFAGDLEYVGGFLGNAQGFPDRDGFSPARRDAATACPTTRLVVFGDSFSGGDLPLHWPDACEDAVRARGGRAELLNFSLTGIGLANWHSILTREVAPRRYDVDGVVFAVWGNDLARRFYVCDHDGTSVHMGGRVETWDPDAYPRTREEALPLMTPLPGFIVGRAEFEAALRGAWRPSRPFEPFLAARAWERLSGARTGSAAVGAAAPGTLAAELRDPSRGRGRLVREMREALEAMGVPVLVVKLPALDELLDRRTAPPDDDARAFAAALGARFLDGAAAYAGLDAAAIRAHWYPVDLHWNQQGSDRFARWMADEVLAWPPPAGAAR